MKEVTRLNDVVASARTGGWLQKMLRRRKGRYEAIAFDPATKANVVPPQLIVPILPHDFDPEAYLAANPDIVDEGMDRSIAAKIHYLSHGRHEGRRLRPG